MANPNALYLLADHIKLSLLERQRAKALDLLQDDGGDDNNDGRTGGAAQGRDAQDGHISRSLDQFRDGLEALRREQARLEGEDDGKAANIADALPALQKQFDQLTAQFEGTATPALAASSSSSTKATKPKPAKAVRFQDKPLPTPADVLRGSISDPDADLEAQRAGLFNRPYRDEPEGDDSNSSSNNSLDHLDNSQLHQMHAQTIADQDAQLDALGASISRQRELSMQIGDELDSHAAMLEETEGLTDRHQSRLDRARRQVGRITRSTGDCKQMTTIVILIVILVLLIIVLK